MIDAYCQSSRFAAQSDGVDIIGACITVDGLRNILTDARIQLNTSEKYGLIGRNGVGKTLLLQSLKSGPMLSPSFRETFRVMLLAQTLETGNHTALDELLRIEDYSIDILEKAEIDAQRRSGARGKKARENLIKLENSTLSSMNKNVESINHQPSELNEDDQELDLNDLFASLENLEFDREKFNQVIKTLKINERVLRMKLNELSGGWRMRISLARALLYPPDLLLMDEPTNHLDIQGIIWLQKQIKTTFEDTTIIFVSHNRSFLNAVANNILLFKNQKIESFRGNYNQYIETIEEKKLYTNRMKECLDRKRALMASSIEKSFKQAAKQNNDKALKQVASRKTKLEERVGFERNEKGHRFKLNRDRIGKYLTVRGEVDEIEDEKFQSRLKFKIPEPELPRFLGPLLIVEDVSFERRNKQNEIIFELSGISFSLSAGQIIAFLGPNGNGKSTLLNLLHDTWTPTRGSIQRKSNHMGYFRQDIVHSLSLENISPLDRLKSVYPDANQDELWKHLGSFGLGSQQVATKTHLSKLSGGQRVAYAFAELSFSAPSVLLLDEPNSHLDLEALEALSMSLAEFDGAVVIVTHDLEFVKDIATDYYWIADGVMKVMENGIDDVAKLLKPKKSIKR